MIAPPDPASNVPAGGATVLDHVGLFVPDMARAARAMERMGFALTPYTPQRHMLNGELVPTGTANRLAVLHQGYIEVLTVTGDTPLADQMRRATGRYTGCHLIAFGTADAEGTHGRLGQTGFDPLPMVRLERGVPTAAGERLARFSVVRVPPDRMPEGRMQFCRHHTPELVWQPERQRHPNRAGSLTDIFLCVDDPAGVAERYGRFLGLSASGNGIWRFELARGRLHLLDRATLARTMAIEAPAMPFMAGFALTSTDLRATRALLERQGIALRELAPDVIAAAMPEGIATTILFAAPDAGLERLSG